MTIQDLIDMLESVVDRDRGFYVGDEGFPVEGFTLIDQSGILTLDFD